MKLRRDFVWPAFVLVGGLFAAVWTGFPAPQAAERADLVVLHAKVYTVNPREPWADAVAVKGQKILAVGTEESVEALRGPETQVIDAQGHVVLPGFTDSHIHFLEGSLTLIEVDLNDARTSSEIEKRLRDYAASRPPYGWIVGQGWTYDVFPPNGLPDRALLDKIFPDRPVYLESYDGHTAWVNARALATAGIRRDTSDPPGGTIVKDPGSGRPTGALIEEARHLVKRYIPMPTRAEKLTALGKGLALANKYGLVRVHAAGEPPDTFGDFFDLDLFEELRREARLTVRFYISRVIEPPGLTTEVVSSLEVARQRYHDEWISVGAAKFFLDGAIETRTGAMLQPYSDDSSTSGTLVWSVEKYNAAVAELDRRGIQVFTHAVGDRAVRLALDAYAQAAKANGTKDLRHRIEHVEVVSPEDLPRFASLGVIASMQPLHASPDPDTAVWRTRVGPERQKLAWAWRSLSNAGALLAFGSDWEVVTMNPWAGVQCAVTRQTLDGQPPGGWIPEQRISVAEAIAGYTIGAAYAGHREKTEGTIETGKLADLIEISQNPFEVAPLKLANTEVLWTMVGGKVVYRASPPAIAKPSKGTKKSL